MPGGSDPFAQRARRRVGAALNDKYRLERVLGVGGMATVFLGVHRNGHRVAVKVLHPELSVEPDIRARFVREGYVANSIDHPGAVLVLDDDIAEDGSVFLVMELLVGETLHARRKRKGGKLPPREAIALVYELCDVLAAAHDKGVIHCDVKPDNVFLTTDRALKVLDFGVARIRDGTPRTTWSGRALGTPAFMPPEQALDDAREVDARTDVWAVGATLFQLLSGVFVHDAERPGALIVHAATRPARPLSSVAPDVPREIADVVDRALAFAKIDRWQTARDMKEALDRAHVSLYGEPLTLAHLSVDSAVSSINELPPGALGAETAAATTEPGSVPVTPGTTLPDPRLSDPPPGDGAAKTLDNAGVKRAVPGASTPPDAPRTLAATAPKGPPRSRVRWIVMGALAVIAIGALAIRPASTQHTPAPAPALPRAECATHLDCAPRGAAICRKDQGRCVALASEDCRVLADPADVTREDTVWFGAMFPSSGVFTRGFGPNSVNAVELARRDFMKVANGLPPLRPGGAPRPIGVVACDDASSAPRAAAHLVDDLGVPAIVGFARSKEVLDLATSIFNPKGVLALASNQATMLSGIPALPGQPRLVYRTTTSAVMVVRPVAALLSEVVEPELRATVDSLRGGAPIRVAMVRVDNASGVSYADTYVSILRFNGKSAAENGDRLHQIPITDVNDPGWNASLDRGAAELLELAPHVVLGNSVHRLMKAVERQWPAGAPYRPRWILPQVTSVDDAYDVVRASPEARLRIHAIDSVMSSPQLAKLVLRYNEVFSPRVTRMDVAGPPYDAFYALAYAAAALGDAKLTGPALAGALRRLSPPGDPIEVGPAGIYPAYAALAAGKNVDLAGTTTSLDFDPVTGDAPADMAVYCFVAPQPGAALDLVESGIVFQARAGKLTGARKCP